MAQALRRFAESHQAMTPSEKSVRQDRKVTPPAAHAAIG
jgi:hypothetical protein